MRVAGTGEAGWDDARPRARTMRPSRKPFVAWRRRADRLQQSVLHTAVVSTLCSVLTPSTVACLGEATALWQTTFASFGVRMAAPATAALTLIDDDGLLDAATTLARAPGVVALRVPEVPRLRAWISSWAVLGFHRRFLHDLPDLIVLQRAQGNGWVCDYEHHVATLIRETQARRLVHVETQQRLLETEKRLESAATVYVTLRTVEAELGEARRTLRQEIGKLEDRLVHYEAHQPMRRMFDGIIELRRRWAPTASARTEVFDATVAGIAVGQRAVLKLLDMRDAVLDRARALRK